MSFLLKIVEGPNKGAEIALVDGVAVTLGKGDDCDIVLADTTMPAEPLVLEAGGGGVTAGGEPLEPMHVKTLGATSFAVGPADAPWGELVWPKAADGEQGTGNGEQGTGNGERGTGNVGSSDVSRPPSKEESPSEDEKPSDKPEKRRGGCCGCIVVLFVLALALAGFVWFFRERLDKAGCFDKVKESRWTEKIIAVSKDGYARTSELIATWRSQEPQPSDARPSPTLQDVAAKYGLSFSEKDGAAKIAGNLKSRRERLAATAEAYALRPGVDLDITDDESLRTSAEDSLFSLTEGALKVSVATNRVVGIVGRAASAAALRRTLEAFNADLPKLRGVDVSGVVISHAAAAPHGGAVDDAPGPSVVRRATRHSAGSPLSLPVCGILTTPYPCLISRDGRRYLEGAEIGGSVILKIAADSVVLTNSTGRFTWKP